jgi:hypothetical protein
MFARIALLSFLWLLSSTVAVAEMPVAGKIYKGPKKFSSPQLGLAFTLPKGFSGGLDDEFFTVVDPADGGRTGVVLLWTSKGKVADAKKSMSQPLVINGATLRPKKAVKVNKNFLTAEYTVVGGGALTDATISAKVAHGTIVALIGAHAPAQKLKIGKLMNAVGRSLKVTKPKVVAAAAGSGSGSGSGEWYKWLAGGRLTRFSTGSGYSEKESYTFCTNGRFFRNFNASSSSGLGTGAANANNSGKWSVSGKGNNGVIVLEFGNGSVDRSAVVYQGGKTYWGGTRYFYEANKCQ